MFIQKHIQGFLGRENQTSPVPERYVFQCLEHSLLICRCTYGGEERRKEYEKNKIVREKRVKKNCGENAIDQK